MKKYTFHDSDIFGEANYDIVGEEYHFLLNTCFKYCHSLSFIVRSKDVSIPPSLLAYRLPVTPFIEKQYERYKYCNPPVQIYHFHLCKDTFPLILDITDSIFKWINAWGYSNPEDPIFYREDNSIFFSSIIHDGQCTLFPHEKENISLLINNPLWIQEDYIETSDYTNILKQ